MTDKVTGPLALEECSVDPAARQALARARELGVATVWDRSAQLRPLCGFGELGLCCHVCLMGPCRIDPFGEGAVRGVCGATAEIIVARNLLRMIAAGAAAHSDHGRGVAQTFRLMSQGKAPSYQVKDSAKLERLMKEYGVDSQMALASGICRACS